AAVVGREGMRGEALDRAARLDPADARAPTVELEGADDVDGHRVGGVRPAVGLVVGARDVFLEVERLDGVRLGAVGGAGEEARHREADVARILRLTERAPGGVLRRLEDLREITRVAQLAPRLHLEE